MKHPVKNRSRSKRISTEKKRQNSVNSACIFPFVLDLFFNRFCLNFILTVLYVNVVSMC